MSIILTAYSYDAFKRFLLPAINDADHTIILSESLFNIHKSLELKLEVTGNRWFFAESDDYRLDYLQSHESCFGKPVLSGRSGGDSVVRLTQDGVHILSIIVSESDNYFSAYPHYSLLSAPGQITIGRDRSRTISYNFENLNLISSLHAQIVKMNGSWMFQDLSSRNGSYVNNRRVQSKALAFGDCIDLFGLRIVFLGDSIAVNAGEVDCIVHPALQREHPKAVPLSGHTGYKGQTIFHRSPRFTAKIDSEEIKIDDAPAPKEEANTPSLIGALGSAVSMSLPMLLGCAFMIYASNQSGMNRGLFMYVGIVTAVSSAIIGTVRSVRAMRKARREYEAYEARRNEKYGAYLQGRENLIREKYTKNTNAMLRNNISAAECAGFTYDNPGLWSRNRNQEDFLTFRLGLGDLPFQVNVKIPDRKFTMEDNALAELPAKIRASFQTLKNVPVTIDLSSHLLVGLVGGRRLAGSIRIVENIVAQAAANNAYTDVKMVFIYNEAKTNLNAEWNFARWLPHVWNETETFRYVASSKEEARNVAYELNKKIQQRIETMHNDTDSAAHISGPWYLIFIASPELLEGEPIQSYLLNPKPEYGLTTLILAERDRDLPNECSYIVENDKDFCGVYSVSDDPDEREHIDFDNVKASALEKLASNIADVRIREAEAEGDIPQSVTFFEMYGIHRPEQLDVLNRWKKNRTYETMRALIGQKAGGEPCYLDIHEKYHGPHGLVAGTTGSGKSETLQTYILSLAINFSPDDVGFFIIDYKGGGMANLFESLPHMIGQISNLSGNQVHRALVAIQSEKDRREALFKEYGVKDIRDYTKLYKKNEAAVPLPHLIIVIDEFAEMKHDQPEFIQEIVSVSRVGRSLGIHLIMATQKPAGSVSEDIWSNSRFKLCLRVQSRQDSMDMLHKPDAAYVTQTGRAYLQVGNDEVYELFQSGFSGAPYTEDDDDRTNIAVLLDMNGTSAIEGNHARIERNRRRKIEWIRTLLQAVQSVYSGTPGDLVSQPHLFKEEIADKIFAWFEQQHVDYPQSEHNKEALVTLLNLIGQYGYDAEAIVKAEAGFTSARESLPQQPQRTQLEAMVSYLNNVAAQNGYDHDFSLFLPLLPVRIFLDQLPQTELPWNEEVCFNGRYWPEHGKNVSLAVSIGLFDDPENQRQDTVVLDLFKTGSIILFGAASTGKTTFLQTFLYGLTMRYSPAEVNIYAFEYSARRLSAFARCPQMGGLVRDEDDNDRIDKFFTMISGLFERRKKILGDASFETYLEIHGMGSMPAAVIMIDNIASLMTRAGDRYNALLSKLLKEGPANGIYLIVTAAGIGNGEISNSLAQSFRTTITLELNSAFDYSNYMRMTHLHLAPEANIKGRGLVFVGSRVLEFQTALPLEAANDTETGEKIRSIADAMNKAWTGDRAIPIPYIPEKPVWSEFSTLPETKRLLASPEILPYGYDAKTAVPCGVDLSDTYVYTISGAKKKGKTTLLRILMLSAHAKGGKVVVIDYDRQFEKICSQIDAIRITTEMEWYTFLKDSLLGDVVARNKAKAQIMKTTEESSEVYKRMQTFEKIYIFADNLPQFVTRCYKPTETIPQTYHEIMETILDKCVLHNIFWFVTVNKADLGSAVGYNLYKLFVRDKKGVHLGGAVYSTAISEMNFENHSRRTADKIRPAGRGMLPIDNGSSVLEVVIPQDK